MAGRQVIGDYAEGNGEPQQERDNPVLVVPVQAQTCRPPSAAFRASARAFHKLYFQQGVNAKRDSPRKQAEQECSGDVADVIFLVPARLALAGSACHLPFDVLPILLTLEASGT